MVLRFLNRALARDLVQPARGTQAHRAQTHRSQTHRRPGDAPSAELKPVFAPRKHEVEQPAPSPRRRGLVLAAVGGVGLGTLTWFGVLPAVTGSGDAVAEALPASSMAVQGSGPGAPADASRPAAADPATAPVPAPRQAAPSERPSAAARDPFAPLEAVGEDDDGGVEPVTVVLHADTTPSPTPSPAPSPSAVAPPAAAPRDPVATPTPATPGVEFSGEPVTVRLLAVTAGTGTAPGEVRGSVDGLVLRLAPGESFASLKLLAVGDPCGAFQLTGEPFVLCEGQERTLQFPR